MADLRPLYKDIPELAAAETTTQAGDMAAGIDDTGRLAAILTRYADDDLVQSLFLYADDFHGDSDRFEQMAYEHVAAIYDAAAAGTRRQLQRVADTAIPHLENARRQIVAWAEENDRAIPHPQLGRIRRLIRNEVRAAVERALEAGA